MKGAAVLLAFVAAGVLAHEKPAAPHRHAHGSHAPLQGVSSVDVYVDGTAVHLLTGEIRGHAASLWHRVSDDGGRSFSAALRVDSEAAPPRAFRRGDDAQVAARGDIVFALWSVAGSGWGGSGPFAGALSRDRGKTWRGQPGPSDSGLTTGHGFADLLFDQGGLHAVWLDSRDKAQGLRYAHSVDGVAWSANTTIAAGTCECCWNSLLSRGAETLVLYRAKGPRDMMLAAFDGAKWVRRAAVGKFDWQFKGCPETGGGLATSADGTLHALAWTGAEGRSGLYALRSVDAGAQWSRPVRLGRESAQHGDLAARGNALAAAWDDAGSVRVSASRDGGAWTKPAQVSSEGRTATHPRVVAVAEGFLVLWTERAKDGPWELRSRIMP